MRVGAAEAGDDDLGRSVGLAVSIGVGDEEDVGRIRDPHAAVSNRNAAWNVEAVEEDRERVALPVAIGVFQNLDAILPRPRFAARVFERLGDPESAPLIDRHRDGIDDVRLGRDDLNREPFRNGHHLRRRLRIARFIRRLVLCVRDRRLLRLLSERSFGDQPDRESNGSQTQQGWHWSGSGMRVEVVVSEPVRLAELVIRDCEICS